MFSYTRPTSPAKEGNPRETREGWPLLTAETEVNGDSKSTNEGVLPCWFVGLVVPVQEILFNLGDLVSPVHNIFSLAVHNFNSFVNIAQPAWEAAMLGHLSNIMCL
jgi:hypothetical protein